MFVMKVQRKKVTEEEPIRQPLPMIIEANNEKQLKDLFTVVRFKKSLK
jgi:hypothetical protein